MSEISITLVVGGPVGDVLCALPADVEEVLVKGGFVVERLDQLDLDITGVGDGGSHLHAGVGASVAEVVRHDRVHVEPGADPLGDPVLHRGLQVVDDVSDLVDLSEDAAHGAAAFRDVSVEGA
jgi:hypothetical protein